MDPESESAQLNYSPEEAVQFENHLLAPMYVNPQAVNMGTAGSYALLAGSTITSTGATQVTGNLGLFPGTSVTGFPPGEITGVQNINNAAAKQAKTDLNKASLDAASRPYNQILTKDVGGQTLNPGVYRATSSLAVTGILKLDCQRSLQNPVWIFQIGSTLGMATGAKVSFVNCLQNSNPQVWWNVGSSATIQTTSEIPGTVMAYASITGVTGANTGPLMARTAAVTLDTNTVTKGSGSLPLLLE
jgi:hypothetical protein